MENYDDELRAIYRSTSMIGYSTSVSVIIYGIIAYYMVAGSANRQPVFAQVEMIRAIFCFVGFSLIVAIGLMNRMNSRDIKKKGLTPAEMLRHFQTRSIVIFGICEFIGILGLILTMMTKNINDYYGLGFLSLFSFGFFFPKLYVWDEQMKGAGISSEGIDS
ncbi:MAG: hypothetical protein KBD53_09435 [Candidatus Omnitrophica bacterium]|nr:hypothetical protein [Candidatus Omnitrophota bacterium]